MAKTVQEQPSAVAPPPQVPRCSVSFRIMNNSAPVPVARPADFIQLTPIIQPMAIVPYSTQEQPLAQFEYDEEY